jgi:hypothetical protein
VAVKRTRQANGIWFVHSQARQSFPGVHDGRPNYEWTSSGGGCIGGVKPRSLESLVRAKRWRWGRPGKRMAFGSSIPNRSIDLPHPVLSQAGGGEEECGKTIQLWIREDFRKSFASGRQYPTSDSSPLVLWTAIFALWTHRFTTGGRWPCDRRIGICSPREICVLSDAGCRCDGGRPRLCRISQSS